MNLLHNDLYNNKLINNDVSIINNKLKNINLLHKDSYNDDNISINNNELKNNKKLRINEFLRDFCEWRKKQGLFVPITWEK